jgi:hypothetical protein
MIGRTNTGGGGSGGGSAFMIVGGTTRPAKAAQNTIWLNTVVEITSYVLSASEPKNLVNGMAWVTIGDSGSIKIASPVGGNWITVYPLSAKQYISGAWEDVEVKSYQNGEWVDWWAGELYDSGNEFETVTGGWVALALKQTSSGNASKPTITRNADSLVMDNSSTNYSGGIVYTAKKIDIKGRSNLVFTGVSNVAQKDRAALTIWSAIGATQADNVVANVALPTTEGSVSIDISALDGSYYVGFALYKSSSTTPTVTMKSLKLE